VGPAPKALGAAPAHHCHYGVRSPAPPNGVLCRACTNTCEVAHRANANPAKIPLQQRRNRKGSDHIAERENAEPRSKSHFS
jgi:hypothetical protein